MEICTAIFRSVENGSCKLKMVPSSKAANLWSVSRMLLLTQTGCVFSKYVLRLWAIVFCIIYEIAWHLSRYFHCQWRIDGGRRMKCTHSLMSVQICLVYTHTGFSFLLSPGHATFIWPESCLLKVKTCFVISVCSFISKILYKGWNQFQNRKGERVSLVEVYCHSWG